MCKKVLLSFDTEEFDMPRERGGEISVEEGVKISSEGIGKILKILRKKKVKATFFVTGNFAKYNPELVEKIIADGHEVGAHGVDHFVRKNGEIGEAKKILEKVTKKKVVGWRQPRMGKIDYKELRRCGYKYDSSVNPAFIPGRYNNSKISREPFTVNGILEIPASVATFLRIPTFWLALHLFPFWFYKFLAKRALKETGLFVVYFHPWEFTDLYKFKIIPWYVKWNSGEKLEKRLEKLIEKLSDCDFVTYDELDSVFVK